ncbi:MAG: SIS domain-containing protein [Butyrivibrio sp.]|nr:SIS domain-containing protein [Ruminococcus flavefaciens]MCM1560247.1 SIS domain-containing protein [Butyrivibrio sp.]
MIELIVLDIDGVITDGTVIVDFTGHEQKQINLKDIDAIFELHRRGYKLAAITGEDTEIVNYFERRFPWEYFYRGSKTKRDTLQQIEALAEIGRENICYVGDGKYDVEPLAYAGLGLCPANAIDKAKHAADMILQNDSGKGCLWELVTILEQYNSENSPQNYFYRRLAEHEDIFKKMASNQVLTDTVMGIAEEILKLLKRGGQVFLCGNGGSAADAQHIATEFISRFYRERPAMNAEALTVNTSTLTAIGNDYSYERVFARQLEAKAKQGDILIGISTSGRSKNVLEALRYAGKNGIKPVMLMGDQDVPELNELCDYVVKVPSRITPRIQEAHIFIGHTIAEYVEHKMFL